jgi:hypothetical protein
MLIVFLLSTVMLSVVKQNVIIPSVEEPPESRFSTGLLSLLFIQRKLLF